MRLINGRGQLGEALKAANIKSNWTVYHTWNFIDKREDVQRHCLEEFIKYVDKNKNGKIIFISTAIEADNHYFNYKRMAEKYLTENCKNWKIVRLPNILGKGICQRLKEGVIPYGTIELILMDQVIH